jgi:hypothetical protein
LAAPVLCEPPLLLEPPLLEPPLLFEPPPALPLVPPDEVLLEPLPHPHLVPEHDLLQHSKNIEQDFPSALHCENSPPIPPNSPLEATHRPWEQLCPQHSPSWLHVLPSLLQFAVDAALHVC